MVSILILIYPTTLIAGQVAVDNGWDRVRVCIGLKFVLG